MMLEARGLNAIPLPYEGEEKYNYQPPSHYGGQQFLPPFLRNLRQEDIILIALIVLLLMEGSNCDLLLVGILVVIFLAGMDGSPGF